MGRVVPVGNAMGKTKINFFAFNIIIKIKADTWARVNCT